MVITKSILERLWNDTCSITEYHEFTKENKSTGFEEVIVLENQRCKLSFETINPTTQTDSINDISQKTKLFIDNAIEIRTGSKIIVQRGSKIFEYSGSGEPAFFSSHQEIMLVPFRGWA